MAFGNVIYEQNRQPNEMGQAIAGAAKSIGDATVETAKLKQMQDERLAQMAVQMLPIIARNPESLKSFTSHPDFGRIKAALTRVGLGSLISSDPATGLPKVNIPAELLTPEKAFGEYASTLKTPEERYNAAIKYQQASAYGKALGAREAAIDANESDPAKQEDLTGKKIDNAADMEKMTTSSVGDVLSEVTGASMPAVDPKSGQMGRNMATNKRRMEIESNPFVMKHVKRIAGDRVKKKVSATGSAIQNGG